MQVLGGEAYQAQAAEQSIRELVVQPARGLIVDDMGRPLVANRTCWVVSLDRTLLHKIGEREQRPRCSTGVARAVKVPSAKVRARTLLCGEPGSMQGTCWNGSPYQPVPVAEDVTPEGRGLDPGAGRGLPGGARRGRRTCAPTPRRTASTPPTCSATSARSPRVSSTRRKGTTTRSVHGASVVGRAGLEKQYDRCLRGLPGYKRVAVDSMGRVLGDAGEVAASPGDTLVTSIDARVQAVAEKHAARRRSRPPARPSTRSRTSNYVADSGAVVVLDANNGRVVAMAEPPTYDPKLWVGGITSKQLKRLYSAKADNPLLFRATQGQFAPGSTWKPIMTARRSATASARDTRLDCSSGSRSATAGSRTTSRRPTGSIDFDKALQISCDTFFYRVGYQFWQKYGTDPRNVNAKDPLVTDGQGLRLRQAHRHRPPGRGQRPDRRPALEAGLLEGRRRATTARSTRRARRRLPAGLRPRVLPRGLPLPRRRRGQLRRSARATPWSRRCSSPAPTPRSPTAARSTSRGSPRRSSRPTAR